jgi:hypothetical protein
MTKFTIQYEPTSTFLLPPLDFQSWSPNSDGIDTFTEDLLKFFDCKSILPTSDKNVTNIY